MKKRILTTIGFGLLTTGGGASIVSLNLSSCSSTITITSYNASTPASSIAQASCSYSSKDVEKDDAWKVGVTYEYTFIGINAQNGKTVHLGDEDGNFVFNFFTNGSVSTNPRDYFDITVKNNKMTFHIKKSIEKNSYISWSAHNGSTQQSWIINGSTLIPLDWAYLSLGGR